MTYWVLLIFVKMFHKCAASLISKYMCTSACEFLWLRLKREYLKWTLIVKSSEKTPNYWKIQWCFICKLKSTDNISYTVKIIDNNYKSYHTVQEISTIIAVMCYHLTLYMRTQYLWMIADSEATWEGPSLRSPPGDEITPLLGATLTFHTTGMSWCRE